MAEVLQLDVLSVQAQFVEIDPAAIIGHNNL
jgi:hypothetical protein